MRKGPEEIKGLKEMNNKKILIAPNLYPGILAVQRANVYEGFSRGTRDKNSCLHGAHRQEKM